MATKWSIPEWHSNNRAKLFHAERSRTIVEHLRDESKKALEETEKHTKNSQRECTTRLSQRVDNVTHWKSEIDEKLDGLNNEIDALVDYRVSKTLIYKLQYILIIFLFLIS